MGGCGGSRSTPACPAASSRPNDTGLPTAVLIEKANSERPPIPCTHPGVQFTRKQDEPVPLSDTQRQTIARADAFIRDHLEDPAARPELVRQKYSRATAFLDARHWTESASSFLDIALNYADEDLSLKSAVGYLESVNNLGSRAELPRTSCFVDMLRYLPIFLDLYCRASLTPPGVSSCAIFFRILNDSRRSIGEKLFEGPPPGPEEQLHLYAEASIEYLEHAKECFTLALRLGLSPKAERCDELAFAAGRASLAAGLPIRAKRALALLRDPKNGVENSESTQRLARAIESTPPSRSCCTAMDCEPGELNNLHPQRR